MDISTEKLAQVILYAHELERGAPELAAFIEGLNEDEAVTLVATMWVGRGSFEPDEFDLAVNVARSEKIIPTEEYLTGSPHFADHIEAGAEMLGLDVRAAQEALL